MNSQLYYAESVCCSFNASMAERSDDFPMPDSEDEHAEGGDDVHYNFQYKTGRILAWF